MTVQTTAVLVQKKWSFSPAMKCSKLNKDNFTDKTLTFSSLDFPKSETYGTGDLLDSSRIFTVRHCLCSTTWRTGVSWTGSDWVRSRSVFLQWERSWETCPTVCPTAGQHWTTHRGCCPRWQRWDNTTCVRHQMSSDTRCSWTHLYCCISVIEPFPPVVPNGDCAHLKEH